LRVTEDIELQTLTMQVELPADPESDELVPQLLVFEDAFNYQVFEGPFSRPLTILDMQVVGKRELWQRVRIETTAGYRELLFRQVRLVNRDAV
jgi:hypothetical protein